MGTAPKEHMVIARENPEDLAGELDDAVADGWSIIGYSIKPDSIDLLQSYSALLQRDKKD